MADKIALGQIEVGIAGGTDTTSDAPVAVSDKLRKKLLKVNRARDMPGRLTALAQIRPGDIGLDIPQNGEPRTRLSMGEHAALTALEWRIGREEQDELAAASHQQLAAAYDAGFLDDQVTPFLGLERDQNLRPDSLGREARHAQARLRQGRGRHHDGRQLHPADRRRLDGAAVVGGLGRGARPAGAGLPDGLRDRRRRLRARRRGAADGTGVRRCRGCSSASGLSLQDFDFYEIHEAFASQVLATLKAWEDPVFCKERLGRDDPLGAIDRDRLNVDGSSLAAGHPFAATGGRIVNVAAKLLAEQGSGRALISICAAGGQGVVGHPRALTRPKLHENHADPPETFGRVSQFRAGQRRAAANAAETR